MPNPIENNEARNSEIAAGSENKSLWESISSHLQPASPNELKERLAEHFKNHPTLAKAELICPPLLLLDAELRHHFE